MAQEKVIIKSAVNSGREYKGNMIVNIELEDGRNGSAFTSDALNWSGEKELIVKEGKEYKGEMQYIFSDPSQIKSKFPMKDYIFEKRNSSLGHSIDSVKLTGKEVTTENIISLARKYYEYLNEK